MLVATSLVRAGLFFILAFVGANVAVILLANLMVSIATTFFAPAELSVIPLVVPRGQLTAANGLSGTVEGVGLLLGALAASCTKTTPTAPTPAPGSAMRMIADNLPSEASDATWRWSWLRSRIV